MIRQLARVITLVALASAGSASLGASLGAQQAKLPPIKLLDPILARAEEPLGGVSTVLALPEGRVLVNDILNRRVVMFDSTLAQVTVVADSTSATANAYGARGGGLLSFGGDSALFIDPASLTMMVVTPAGTLAGVRAVPRAGEINLLVGGPNGRPGFDAQGRMVYRGQARPRPAPANARPAFGNFVLPILPDSAPVVRMDMRTRKLDTIATVKIPKIDVQVTEGNDGRPNISTRINPFPVTDDWALMSDGSIAVVRGHDFHIDWVAADGSVTSSPKLPYEWQRLDDEEKMRILDSARVAIEEQRDEAMRRFGQGGVAALAGASGFDLGGGGGFMMMGGAGGGGGPQQRGGGAGPGGAGAGPGGGRGGNAGGAGGPGGFRAPTITMVNPNDLTDYRPPFLQQSALGDMDGNLWVRTTSPTGDAGSVYYVIDRAGTVIARVQPPQGRMIAGFGRDGIVYMGFRDVSGNSRLESARWK